jgi:hypothetical protein
LRRQRFSVSSETPSSAAIPPSPKTRSTRRASGTTPVERAGGVALGDRLPAHARSAAAPLAGSGAACEVGEVGEVGEAERKPMAPPERSCTGAAAQLHRASPMMQRQTGAAQVRLVAAGGATWVHHGAGRLGALGGETKAPRSLRRAGLGRVRSENRKSQSEPSGLAAILQAKGRLGVRLQWVATAPGKGRKPARSPRWRPQGQR